MADIGEFFFFQGFEGADWKDGWIWKTDGSYSFSIEIPSRSRHAEYLIKYKFKLIKLIFLILANIERWTRAISSEQDRLSKAEESFQNFKEDETRFLAEMDGIEMERDFKKKELEIIDDEMAKIRHEAQKMQKEAESCRKSVMELEILIERKKAERHIVLKQAKVIYI